MIFRVTVGRRKILSFCIASVGGRRMGNAGARRGNTGERRRGKWRKWKRKITGAICWRIRIFFRGSSSCGC